MPNVQEILDEIELELVQSAIPSDELSQAVQTVKRYQNKLRDELFVGDQKLDRHAVARLFQVNDMLLTVLQEMASALQTAQHPTRARVVHPADASPDAVVSRQRIELREPRQIERVMRADTLHIDVQARLTRVPLIGWLIGRAQIFWHRPALYYTHLLADRQMTVNRALGDWVLSLHEEQSTHAAELERVRARLDALEVRAAR